MTSDNLSLNISLLGILGDDEMTTLLRQQLEADGWKPAPDGTMSAEVSGAVVTLGADGRTIKVEAEASRESETWLDDDYSEETKNQRMEQARKNAEITLKADVLRKLEKVEPEVRAALDGAVQKVYIEALKRKAASLGQIESMQEDRAEDGTYEITIKVKA